MPMQKRFVGSSGSRRTATSRSLVTLAALVLIGCGGDSRSGRSTEALPASDAPLRLEAHPRVDAKRCAPGEYELRFASNRRALMRVTPAVRGRPRALLVALHGAGSGGAPGGLYAFRGAWGLPGLAILAPAAAGTAWTLGPTDVRFVDRALQRAFARCKVDARRIAIGGFSSGAGMALWLGLSNGDLFHGVIVLSGGGSLPDRRVGKPRVFVAHGTLDRVIPVGVGGDEVVRELRAEGYDVIYRRFRGGHRVLPPIARESVVQALGR